MDGLVPEDGWNLYGSQAEIGKEAPGAPVPDGSFARAVPAVAAYEFSDPRIVVGYFDPAVPLLDRPMLLEIKVLGLRYLNPAVVAAVRSEGNADYTVFGFRYDTLEGHIEAGAEWFLLIKDHGTGIVRFRMEAAWRPGQFPNRWSRLGFRLLARRYQRAWHRLAYLRLRALVGAEGLQPLPRSRRLVHEGPAIPGPGLPEALR